MEGSEQGRDMIPIITITPAAEAARAEAEETRQEVVMIFQVGADGGLGRGDGSVFWEQGA